MNIFLNSNDWTLTHYRVTHNPTNTTFWVANGWMFFDGYDSTPPFLSFIERYFWHRKFTKMIKSSLCK